LVTKDAGVGTTHGRAVRRLDLGAVKRPFLEIERSARIELEAIGRMVRVGRVDAAQHADAKVGFSAPFSVLEEEDVRRLGDEDAAVIELEAGGTVQMVGEDRYFIRLAGPF